MAIATQKIKAKNCIKPINLDKDFEHPTIKPLKFIRTMIENSKSETYARPLWGVAQRVGQRTNRQYLGIEINPKWHKIACDRLNCVTAGGQQSLFLM